jgi:hypothetical protein
MRLPRLRFRGRRGLRSFGEAEPGRLALDSIAADPALLARLPRDQARRIACQAETLALDLLRRVNPPGEPSLRDQSSRALRAIRDFLTRDDLLGTSVETMIASVRDDAPDGLGGLLASIRHSDGGIGRAGTLAFDAILALDEDGLRRLDHDDAELLMAAAIRHVAERLRGDETHAPPTGRALAIVGRVCMSLGILPLPPRVAGARARAADHLVALWRDAATCAVHAAPNHHDLWERSRDGHAFGAVWLSPSVLTMLVRAEAEQLGRDAGAAAGVTLRSTMPGHGRAIEAACEVLIACDGWAAEAPLRLAAPRAHASHA